MPGKTILPMAIDDYSCAVEDDVSNTLTRGVIEHRPIGYNGPLLEDTGLESNRLVFNTLWSGDNYAGHDQFLTQYANRLSTDYLYRITHPEYGDIYGAIVSAEVTHKFDEINGVHIRITFVQEGESRFSRTATSLTNAVAGLAQSLADEAVATVDHSMFTGGSGAGREKVAAGTITIKSAVTNGMIAADHFINDLRFGLSLPSQLVEQAFRYCASAEESTDRVLRAPSSAIAAFRARIAVMIDLFRHDDNGQISEVLAIASALSVCRMSATALDSYRRSTRAESQLQPPTHQDVEGVVWQARDCAGPVIAAYRGQLPSLEMIVATLTDDGSSILSRMGVERQHDVPRPTNIYVILMELQIPTSRAEAICARNNIENPNRVVGRIWV